MKVEVTDKVSGLKLAVDPSLVRLLEPMADGSCHIAFSEGMGRVVVESYDQLKPFFDVVVASAGAAALKAMKALRK